MFRGMKAFKKTILDFVEEVPRGGHKIFKVEAARTFAEVVRLTPKDTGFASSMWKHIINKRPGRGKIPHPGGDSYAPANTPSFYNLKATDKLYIYNNVEYIVSLENGYSSKAPRNFFKNTVRRGERRLQRKLDAFSKKAKSRY